MTDLRSISDNKAGLTRLMQMYEKDILNLCCMLLHDIALAEDAVQETFFKAYKGLDAFRGDSAEKTWLMRIAINTCKDIRRGAWYRFVDRRVTLERIPAPSVPSKAENVLITTAVMRLPTKECEAVLLRYYQNMNVKEIAQALGVSSSAISKRLKRALQRLNLDWEGGRENE